MAHPSKILAFISIKLHHTDSHVLFLRFAGAWRLQQPASPFLPSPRSLPASLRPRTPRTVQACSVRCVAFVDLH